MKERQDQTTLGIEHPFPPVADARSRALVLGSFPSVKSRENAFYYGHPQNRFWRVLAGLFAVGVPRSIEDKTTLLLDRNIALWDVVFACDIVGSADSTLTPHAFNDIGMLLGKTRIQQLFANGQKAGDLYRKQLEKAVGYPIRVLPSTSPANAAWSLERLIEAWDPLRAAVEESTKKTKQHL